MAYFRRIFWGLLLAGIPATMDGLVYIHAPGYFLLALGTGGLVDVSRRFGWAKVLSWVGIVWLLVSVWLFDLLMIGDPVTRDSIVNLAPETVIDCLLAWTLFGGIGDYTRGQHRPDIATYAYWLRVVLVVLLVAAVFVKMVPGAIRYVKDPFEDFGLQVALGV